MLDYHLYEKFLGGSDDAAGCAVMLEILRIITQSPKILKHSVVFLFNGAEENLLQVYLISNHDSFRFID